MRLETRNVEFGWALRVSMPRGTLPRDQPMEPYKSAHQSHHVLNDSLWAPSVLDGKLDC